MCCIGEDVGKTLAARVEKPYWTGPRKFWGKPRFCAGCGPILGSLKVPCKFTPDGHFGEPGCGSLWGLGDHPGRRWMDRSPRRSDEGRWYTFPHSGSVFMEPYTGGRLWKGRSSSFPAGLLLPEDEDIHPGVLGEIDEHRQRLA